MKAARYLVQQALIAVVLCGAFCGFACDGFAAGVSAPVADLEVGLGLRQIFSWDRSGRFRDWPQTTVGIGLGYGVGEFVSFHGNFEFAWLAFPEGALAYYRHNRAARSAHVAGLGLRAQLEVHTGSRVVGVFFYLGAQSYFLSGRGGLWDVMAGVGVMARPFVESREILRNVSFGVASCFPVYNDVTSAFGMRIAELGLSFQVVWAF